MDEVRIALDILFGFFFLLLFALAVLVAFLMYKEVKRGNDLMQKAMFKKR